MNVYLAACNIKQYRAAKNKEKNHVLLSYHYWKSEINIERILGMIKSEATNIFIDSGAFSAFNSGTEIKLKEYIEFIRRVNINHYAALDVIYNAEKTYENLCDMMKEGLSPIPTFHMKTDIKHLDRLLTFDYIALGGMVGSPDIDGWLSRVWNYIMKNKPEIKVHGFGLTDIEIVKKYPWHSIDSTSWHTIGRNGYIQLWNPLKNKFYRLSEFEYKKRRDLPFEIGNSELEDIGDSESAKDFQYFEDYLNTFTNFSLVSAQTTMF